MNNLTLQQAGLTPERVNALATLVTQAIENIEEQVEMAKEQGRKALESKDENLELARKINKIAGKEIIPEDGIDDLINEKVEEVIAEAKKRFNYSMLLELHPILHELKFELSNE